MSSIIIKGKNLSAKTVILDWQKVILIALMLILYFSFTLEYTYTIFWTVTIINIVYAYTGTYRLWLIFTGAYMLYEDFYHHAKIELNITDYPKYTLLLPMFKEAEVIPDLMHSMKNLDYPKDKLQILLILEEEDIETLLAIKSYNPPSYFQVIIVPKSNPQTKGKASNYALQFATGEIVGIYDAEDVPDPLQLKKVVKMFAVSDPDIACIQCRLRFYNGSENILTSLFEIEYQTQYNFIFPVASYYNYPMPLGGSSNHFRIDVLKEVGAWDPYNLTEDADLGLRLAAYGYRTRVIISYTGEEATNTLMSWIKQRTRWLQGYMHTCLIYSRYPVAIFRSYHFFGYLFFLYIMFLSPLLTVITPFMFILSFLLITGVQDLPLGYDIFLRYLTWANLFYTMLNFIFTAYIISKVAGHKYLKYRWFLFVLYFIIIVYASYRALHRLIISSL